VVIKTVVVSSTG